MEDLSTHSDKYDAQHRGETKDDAPRDENLPTIAAWIRFSPTPTLRALIGSLSAELRLRMHTDAANYLAKAVACLEEPRAAG